jgi:RNA polymerase sigma-70 factor, ECF subfamily
MRFPDERLRSAARSGDPAPAPLRAGADPGRDTRRRSRPELPDPRGRQQHLWQPGTDLRAWLFTIQHNQHANEVRRSVREGINVELTEAPQLTAQSNAIDSLQLRDLKRAMDELAPEQRQVILLVGLEGLAYEEVAVILGVPVGTVRSRLSGGRDQLRRLMGIEEKRERLRAA